MPWGNPTRNIFGWQRPCYLLGEGYVGSFRELMEETNWDQYGTGNYEKCANCMVHCGYEPTAVDATVRHPVAGLKVWWRGVGTDKPMAPEISLENQRSAEFVFEQNVQQFLSEGHAPAAEPSGAGSKEEGTAARSDAA